MTLNAYMHPRNIYRTRPDFKQLAEEFPDFAEYAIPDERGRVHVNFKDAKTLRCLTKTLLKKDFGLNISIPENCLIPTIPQRLNYILWIEDLLETLPDSGSDIVKGIDIGTGPCCVFSVLGARKNDWEFLATDTEEESLKWAHRNIVDNDLENQIELLKVDKDVILKGPVKVEGPTFDFSMCNPPFFHDVDDMLQRKKDQPNAGDEECMELKKNELIVEGGEVEFIQKMIRDSKDLGTRVRVYTSMFGKKKSQVDIKKHLKCVGVNYTFTEFCQGNTMRWGVAWTYLPNVNLSKIHCSKRKKKKKPLNFLIPKSVGDYTIKKLFKRVVGILQELSIQHEVKTETRLNVLLLIKATENTWSHQRRRRRQALLQQGKNECQLQSKGGGSTFEEKLPDVACDALKPPCNSKENLLDSAEDNKKDSSTADIELMECAETLLRMDSVEQMDTAVPPDCQKSCSDFEGQILSEATSVVKTLSSDLNSSVTEQNISAESSNCEAPSCDISCECNLGGNSSGIKRIHDEENARENSDSKRFKVGSSETQNDCMSMDTDVKADSVPLLLCELELKRHCDKIMLELNCEEHCNRQSMLEIFQLFKNRLK